MAKLSEDIEELLEDHGLALSDALELTNSILEMIQDWIR